MDPFINLVLMKTAYLILIKKGILKVFLVLYLIFKGKKWKK
jgi:hypothetical protein